LTVSEAENPLRPAGRDEVSSAFTGTDKKHPVNDKKVI
jgi:hypothetical protein